MHRHIILLCTLAAALVVGIASADARVVEKLRYSDSESFTDTECGYPLDVVIDFEGQLVIRDTKGGEAFRGSDRYEFRAVVTNPENGKWFVVRGSGLFNEIRAKHVEGDIYEFVAHESGQLFVLEDADGNVIARDTGRIEYTFLFDTLGDGQPGGEFVTEPDIDLAGRFPSHDLDYCETVDRLVGS